jgi:hypothetical protein
MKQIKLKKWIGILLLNSIMGMEDSFDKNEKKLVIQNSTEISKINNQYEDEDEGFKKFGQIPTKKSLPLQHQKEKQKTNFSLEDVEDSINQNLRNQQLYPMMAEKPYIPLSDIDIERFLKKKDIGIEGKKKLEITNDEQRQLEELEELEKLKQLNETIIQKSLNFSRSLTRQHEEIQQPNHNSSRRMIVLRAKKTLISKDQEKKRRIKKINKKILKKEKKLQKTKYGISKSSLNRLNQKVIRDILQKKKLICDGFHPYFSFLQNSTFKFTQKYFMDKICADDSINELFCYIQDCNEPGYDSSDGTFTEHLSESSSDPFSDHSHDYSDLTTALFMKILSIINTFLEKTLKEVSNIKTNKKQLDDSIFKDFKEKEIKQLDDITVEDKKIELMEIATKTAINGCFYFKKKFIEFYLRVEYTRSNPVPFLFE